MILALVLKSSEAPWFSASSSSAPVAFSSTAMCSATLALPLPSPGMTDVPILPLPGAGGPPSVTEESERPLVPSWLPLPGITLSVILPLPGPGAPPSVPAAEAPFCCGSPLTWPGAPLYTSNLAESSSAFEFFSVTPPTSLID